MVEAIIVRSALAKSNLRTFGISYLGKDIVGDMEADAPGSTSQLIMSLYAIGLEGIILDIRRLPEKNKLFVKLKK